MQYLQEDSHSITVWYNIILGGVSMIFIIFGFHFLFVSSEDNNIGSHDRGMGLVVVIISTLLVCLEIVLIIMVYEHKILSYAFDIFIIVFTFEKIVQVAVYIIIRRCRPHPDFKRGAVFYFNFLSFLNFTMWLNSIPFTDIPIYDEVSHTPILQYVDLTFKALLIDYRLLCALLFLEHALAIDEDEDENVHNQVDEEYQMPESRRFYTATGLGIGLLFLILEIINCVRFWYKSFPEFVNIFPILVDAALAVFGYALLRNVNNTSVFHDKKVTFVSLMVTSMGAASIVYLFCFSMLSFTSFRDEEPVSCVIWAAFVFIARASSLLVLLIVYAGIPLTTMESSENYTTKNYFIVSSLCFGLFARLIGNILDEFKGDEGLMHKIAHRHLGSNKLRPLRDLFAIGPLFQLAASLHLALHFLLMLLHLHERPKIAHQQENAQNEHGQRGGDGRPIRDNYGAMQGHGVARQSNARDIDNDGTRRRQGEHQSGIGSSSVLLHVGSEQHQPTYNEHSRLLQTT